jgi:hypothetical protein
MSPSTGEKMTTTSPTPPLHELVAPTREHLVPILEAALELCVERHALAEGKGADGFSFGTDAWSLPARVFADRAAEGAIPFDVSNIDGCQLVFGAVALRHHRVGERASDDIAQSFPRNAGAAGRGASRQLAFPFEPPWSEDTPAVVLAYMANPAEGLCAVYLATVGQTSRGKITAWGETVEVWRRGDEAAPAEVAPPVSAPAETVAAPIVRRGPKKAKTHGRR